MILKSLHSHTLNEYPWRALKLQGRYRWDVSRPAACPGGAFTMTNSLTNGSTLNVSGHCTLGMVDFCQSNFDVVILRDARSAFWNEHMISVGLETENLDFISVHVFCSFTALFACEKLDDIFVRAQKMSSKWAAKHELISNPYSPRLVL